MDFSFHNQGQESGTPSRRRGVTWSEMLVYTLVFGGLGAVVVPQFSQAQSDPMAQRVMGELSRAQDAIELYQRGAGEGQYPDLVNEGWQPLIRAGLLQGEPANPISGQTGVGAEASAGLGWHYDRATGTLGACYFNESSRTIDSNTP